MGGNDAEKQQSDWGEQEVGSGAAASTPSPANDGTRPPSIAGTAPATTASEGSGADKHNDGMLVRWGDEDDGGTNPLTWSTAKKAGVLSVIASGSMCVTCASSVVSTTYGGLERDLGMSHEVAILGLSIFVVGLGLGPCILAPFSEFYGRRPIYLISFGAFFLLGLPVAFANNIAVFLVFRFLTGFAGSSFLSIAGGSISDMWEPGKSLIPMACYTCTPFLGPVIGPVYGGFIESFASTWRWSFWVITIWSFLTTLALYFGAPETYAPILLVQRASQRRARTGNQSYYAQHERDMAGKSLGRTVVMSSSRVFSLLVLEPMLLLLCLWCAVILGILYLFFQLFPIVFAKHNFQPYQTGLTFIGIGIGIFAALATMPYWDAVYHRKAAANGGVAPLECRLDMAKVASVMTPAGLFIFAFTSYAHVHWIGPIIGSAIFGWALLYIYISCVTYTVVQWRPVAASAMGANSMLRSSFAAGFPLFSTQMAARLGTTGTAALLAGLNCLLIPLPFVFAHYGARLRAKSRFSL